MEDLGWVGWVYFEMLVILLEEFPLFAVISVKEAYEEIFERDLSSRVLWVWVEVSFVVD
jgi:hypothetical protein